MTPSNDARCRQCELRLSVVDTDGRCMFCRDLAAAKLTLMNGTRHVRQYDPQGRPLCRCGQPVAYRGMCAAHASEQTRERRRRAMYGRQERGRQ